MNIYKNRLHQHNHHSRDTSASLVCIHQHYYSLFRLLRNPYCIDS